MVGLGGSGPKRPPGSNGMISYMPAYLKGYFPGLISGPFKIVNCGIVNI